MKTKHWVVLAAGVAAIISGCTWQRGTNGPTLILFGVSAVAAAPLAALIEKKGGGSEVPVP